MSWGDFMTALWILLAIAAVLTATVCLYAYRNTHFDVNKEKRMFRAGFTEKQAVLPDGTVLNYGEGPVSGPPLLLIHGQGVTWKNYAAALPDLAKRFHVYAVDCHGHGDSSFHPAKYTAKAMGADFIWFVQHVIGQSTYVSGHSSGGLLTVWLAANAPAWVRGIVIEDAPLFSTEVGEKEQTFAYRENFCLIHEFLHQTAQQDFLTYYLERCCWKDLMGKGWPKMMQTLATYRVKHPDRRPKVWWLPPSINQIWVTLSDPYDLRFGEAFYDQTWFADFDQAAALRSVRCPAVFLKAATRWRDGLLMAALSEEDCQRVCALLSGCRRMDFPKSGHGIHEENPREFAAALARLAEQG